MRKRASLNLSIQAIVIIVLAMTLLGLGLAFVRGQFAQITAIGTEVQEQVREQITGQLRVSGEKISFPRDITFSRGEAKTLTLGVQNVGATALYFKVNMSWDLANSDFDRLEISPSDFELRWDTSCLQLLPADSEVYGIRGSAPRTPGTFALRASVESYTEGCEAPSDPTSDPTIYTTKLAFITVG